MSCGLWEEKRLIQENSKVSNFRSRMNGGTVNRDGDHCVEQVWGVRRRVWVCMLWLFVSLWHFIVFRNQDWDSDVRYRSEQYELIDDWSYRISLFLDQKGKSQTLLEFVYNVNIYVYLKCKKASMHANREWKEKQILFESGRRKRGKEKGSQGGKFHFPEESCVPQL